MKKRNGQHGKSSDLLKLGKKIYSGLETKLENRYKGKIVAIEVESGNFSIGQDELEAAKKAQEKFPDKKFAFFRVGFPVVHKLRKSIQE